MGIHQTANYTGIIAAGLIAGYIADHYGWREAFYLFGSLGIVWSLVLLARLKHTPPPGEVESEDVAEPEAPCPASERIPLRVVAREVFRKPTFWVLCLAFGGHQFAMIGYLTWMPTFLYEKFHLSLTEAGFYSMLFHHLAAMLGVLIGGRLSDRWSQRRSTARMETEVLGLLLGAPFILLMGTTENLWMCYVGLTGFGLARGIYDSNLFAAQFDVIPPWLRSSSVGFMLAFGFLVGGVGPWMLGWIKQTQGLTSGIASLSVAYLLAGLCVAVGLKAFFAKDYYRGPAEG
jgi:sugar phosphate permease